MKYFCIDRGIMCEHVGLNGECNASACLMSTSNNTHNENLICDLKTSSGVEDGLYLEIFAVKDNKRYNIKVINIKDVASILTGSLMDGIEKLISGEI